MKVLITNAALANYSGTETVVRDLAFELKRQGHEPALFTARLGQVAEELISGGVPAVTDLADLKCIPDVIHGHHHRQVSQALAHFASVPGIYVCHGARNWEEEPFYFPRLLRYVAVDELCFKRTQDVIEIPRDRIEVILNAVNLERFSARKPLPSKPRRALVFSNYANWRTHLPAIRRACRRMGLSLDVIGQSAGTAAANPEAILPHYDLVFAKARCALEAMAVGNAVVLCDFLGVGPLVTAQNFETLRRQNFGAAALTAPLSAESLCKQIDLYDAADAGLVSERVRQEAGLVQSAERWVSLYQSVVDEFRRMPRDFDGELRAFSTYAANWSYYRRLEWENHQIDKLRKVPVLGSLLSRAAHVTIAHLERQK